MCIRVLSGINYIHMMDIETNTIATTVSSLIKNGYHSVLITMLKIFEVLINDFEIYYVQYFVIVE